MATASSRSAPIGRDRLKAIIGGSTGNLVEWYDWYAYAAFTLYFAPHFFPSNNPTAELLGAAAVFAVGFMMRPLGAWMMGIYADRRGRKSGLALSVTLMCAGSLLIAISPTYETAGLLAPSLLVIARLMQGLSVGGEYGASATYLSEMAGKDLIDSVTQSSKIARVLGGRPPEGFNYEMFLDEKGEKISKSKGNGLSLDQWLTYGPEESLAFFAYREPKKAKALHFGVIPRAVDDYWQFRGNYPTQELPQKLGNPVHHIHDGNVPSATLPVTFGLLLNLVGVMGEASKEQVWGYLRNYVPDATPERDPELDRLIGYALAYARDFVAPTLKRRAPEGVEVEALRRLDADLAALPADASAEDIQNVVYEIGKTAGFESLRDWFKALYETLLGSEQGPRMGSFIALYGVENSRTLIAEALAKATA